MTRAPIPLDSWIKLGGREWKVSAVMWIGERYYLLIRRRNPRIRATEQVALMPASIVEEQN